MILRPALRFLTGPFPPGVSAARALAAVILPPLLFFAISEFTSLIPFFPLATAIHTVRNVHSDLISSQLARRANRAS